MNFGSLFSGIGGFDLGFEQAGLSCSWQVEIDGDCGRVLEKHWSGVVKHKDVRDVGKLESVDVICGGFPCQDLSVAGQRKGLDGERSGLWFEFLRIVGLNRPRWVVIENVPGLFSSDEHRDFATILRGLVECGYCIAWRVLDAQFYGVAQRRRRVFIVGSLGDGSCAEILFESKSVSWNPPTRREAGAGVTPCIDGSPYADREAEHGRLVVPLAATLDQRGRGPTDAVMMNLQVQPGYIHPRQMRGSESSNQVGIKPDAEVTDALTQEGPGAVMVQQVTHALRAEGADASEDGTGRGTPLVCATLNSGGNNGGFRSEPGEHLVAFTLHGSDKTVSTASQTDVAGSVRTKAPGSIENSSTTIVAFSSKDHGADAGEIAPTLRSQNFDKSHINGGGQVAIAFTERTRSEGRTFEAQEELAYAITNPGSGGRTHSRQVAGGFGVRRLTPRECERLQGFPDDFTRYDANGKEISDSARYRMLGNAVAVPVSRWIASRIIGREK